jgi:hypothetical protein
VASEDKSCSNARKRRRANRTRYFTSLGHGNVFFFWPIFLGTQKRGVAAPKPSDEVAIEAFAKIDVSADISARGSRRTPNIFAAWLINAPTFSI